MRIISILTAKGGSAKTTTSVCLSACLAELKKKVLLIDLDPFISSSRWCGFFNKDTQPAFTMFDVFSGNTINGGENAIAGNSAIGGKNTIPSNAIINMICENNRVIDPETSKANGIDFDVAPASLWMTGLPKMLAGEIGAEFLLKRHLAELPEDKYDFILMDCPGGLGTLSVNALTASDDLIMPVQTQALAVYGLMDILMGIDDVRERLNENLGFGRILACQHDRRTKHNTQVLEKIRQEYGDKVFETVIQNNIRLPEASSWGQPITKYDTKSQGAEDYRALAKEILQ